MVQPKINQDFLEICKFLAQMCRGGVKTRCKHPGALSSRVHSGLPERRWPPSSVMVVLMGPSFSWPAENIRAHRAVEDPNNSSPLNRCSALYDVCIYIQICTHCIQKGHMYSYTQRHIDCSENQDSWYLKFRTCNSWILQIFLSVCLCLPFL